MKLMELKTSKRMFLTNTFYISVICFSNNNRNVNGGVGSRHGSSLFPIILDL